MIAKRQAGRRHSDALAPAGGHTGQNEYDPSSPFRTNRQHDFQPRKNRVIGFP